MGRTPTRAHSKVTTTAGLGPERGGPSFRHLSVFRCPVPGVYIGGPEASSRMDRVLLTGATGFLGYHVAKKLNSAGIRPRVLELREGRQEVLNQLDVYRCAGYLEDASAVRAACQGVDTLLHLAFKVSVGSGKALAEEMQRINITGTRDLLETAAACGVKR